MDVVKVQQWLITMMDIHQRKEDIVMKLLSDMQQSNTVYGLKTGAVKSMERIIRFMIRCCSCCYIQIPHLHVSWFLCYTCCRDMRRMETRLLVARFIVEKLAQAPWNVTEAYLKGHVEYDKGGKNSTSVVSTLMSGGQACMNATVDRIDLFGVGDPSGVGDGYAFVR